MKILERAVCLALLVIGFTWQLWSETNLLALPESIMLTIDKLEQERAALTAGVRAIETEEANKIYELSPEIWETDSEFAERITLLLNEITAESAENQAELIQPVEAELDRQIAALNGFRSSEGYESILVNAVEYDRNTRKWPLQLLCSHAVWGEHSEPVVIDISKFTNMRQAIIDLNDAIQNNELVAHIEWGVKYRSPAELEIRIRKTVVRNKRTGIVYLNSETSNLIGYYDRLQNKYKAGVYGPIADKVIYEVRREQAAAVRDVITGTADIYIKAVYPGILQTLPKSDLGKLDQYNVPSGSWSLLLNNYPNQAPYTGTKDGVSTFNPMAIREIRYALNWLFDRQKMIDEILAGAGTAAFTGMTPGQPGTYRYNLIPARLGMTAQGDESRAIAEIEAAMLAASRLPANRGRLLKPTGARFWQFDGRDVTVKFLMRVDDPQGRLLAGRYMADQIEKAGLKVLRMELDRTAISIAYYSNPADMEFHVYTEGWGAGASRAWWDIIISQMYAPYYGYMPGGADPENWNYSNPELDRLGMKGLNGLFLSEQEYWSDNLKAMSIALNEAVRIYLCSQHDTFIANKARFNQRMAYGLGDGLNGWSIRTADIKPGPDGSKILRVVQQASGGSLFLSPWDPVGVNGFSDVYAISIIDPVSDPGTFMSPNTVKTTQLRSLYELDDYKNSAAIDNSGRLVGQLAVPPQAVLYDSRTKSWKAVGNGRTAISAVTSTYNYGTWHSGVPIEFADLAFALAFVKEWSTQDGPDDRFYDSAFDQKMTANQQTAKGYVFNADGSVTNFYDFHWPMEPEQAAAYGGVSPKAGNPGRPSVVPWDIYEACALLVAEGSASGRVYSFNAGSDAFAVDLTEPAAVADLKAKLEDMKTRQYVPVCISQWMNPQQATARYDASLNFLAKYGHLYISNGPFLISKLDRSISRIELTAFRDYVYPSRYWQERFAVQLPQIDAIASAATASRRTDYKILVQASGIVYPSDLAEPLSDNGKVSITLQKHDGTELFYPARNVSAGIFEAVIPAAVLGSLPAGDYIYVVTALAGEHSQPAIQPAGFSLF